MYILTTSLRCVSNLCCCKCSPLSSTVSRAGKSQYGSLIGSQPHSFTEKRRIDSLSSWKQKQICPDLADYTGNLVGPNRHFYGLICEAVCLRQCLDLGAVWMRLSVFIENKCQSFRGQSGLNSVNNSVCYLSWLTLSVLTNKQLLITFVMLICSPVLPTTHRSWELCHEREQFHLWKQGDFQVLLTSSAVPRCSNNSR